MQLERRGWRVRMLGHDQRGDLTGAFGVEFGDAWAARWCSSRRRLGKQRRRGRAPLVVSGCDERRITETGVDSLGH